MLIGGLYVRCQPRLDVYERISSECDELCMYDRESGLIAEGRMHLQEISVWSGLGFAKVHL